MTLVEISVALALLAVLVTGVFATLATAQRAEVATRENQAVAAAVFQQIDVVNSHPSFEGTITTWDGATFHVPYGEHTLEPASLPLNAGPDREKTGRIAVLPVDVDGDGAPDDYDGDGVPDLIEIRVFAAWRSADGSDRHYEALLRRTR